LTDTSNSLTPEQIAELKRRRDERQGKVIDFNTQRNVVLETDTADDAAYDLKKSQELGIPREAIGGAREEYRAEDTLRKMQEMRQAAPKASEWLTQPDNYAVAKDDVETLSQLETTLKKIPPTKPQYALGTYNITPAVEMFKGAFADPKKAAAQVGDVGRSVFSAAPMTIGSVSSGLGSWLDSAITFTEKNIYGNIPVVNRGVQEAIDWERRFFARHPEVAKTITPYAGPSAILKTYGAEGKKIQQAWQPADMGFEDKVAQGVGQMVVQVGLALATGGTSMGAAISTGSFMAMGADQQAEALKAAGLNPDEYFGQLSAGAAITGSAEMMRLNSIMKILPPAMRDRVTKSVVSRIASQAFEEGAQEAIEGVLHNVVTMSYDPRATILGGVAEAGAVGGTVGGLFQGLIELLTPGRMRGGTGVQLDKLMADMAREETEIAESADEKALAETIARVGQMKLTGLSPEKAAEVIGRVTEGTGVETVTVDLDGAVEALQQAGVDPVEALSALGVSEEQLGQRFERFGEIEVSTATLLTSPLMRDNASIVTPHLRTGADSVTPAKKEALREEFQAQVKERVAEIEEALAGGRELADKEQAVLDRVTERLSASGMFPERRILDAQAAVQAATVNTFAARIGMDPVEFYEQHFPKVQGSIDGMVMEENALDQSWFKGFGKKQDQGPRTQDTIGREIKDIEKKLRRKGYTLNEAETLAEDGTLPPELRGLMIQHGDLVRESGRMQGAARTAKGGVETDPEYLRAESEMNKAMDDVANAEYEIALELREKGLTWEGDDAEFMGVVDQLRREGKLSNYIASRVQDLRDASTRMFDAQEKMQARVKAFAPPESYPVNTGQAPVVPGFRALSPEEKAAFRPSQGFDPARKRMTQDTDALEQERRGQFSPDTNTVTLFEQSDVTTMLHEGAHWYLETLFRMATSENPHPFVTEQYNAILAWGKVGSNFEMYDAAGRLTPEGRELHETWAETFEVYIQTGKAPTSALRDTFRAFKTWITALWKRMYGGGQPARANLNPEVIAIMDRMLAVDEEIEAEVAGIMVGAQAQAKALLDAKVITQAQYDKALANLDEAREKAKEDFGARVMADKMREDEAWWNTEKRRVRGDVIRELDRSPIGRALSWLGYGQWKGDVPVSETPTESAETEFYQGADRGEAQEWTEAVAKGLPMDQASRMARAQEQGWVGGYYHGTTANVRAFDLSKANIESDWGAGVYLSNTPGDVASNYAGLGPDLTNKIEREAERIASETDRDYNDPEVIAEARAKWVANEGMTMPLMVRLRNPVIVGGPNETKFTYEEAYDEETDEYGEPTGTLIDFMESLGRAAENFDDADVSDAVSRLQERAMDYGEIGISDAVAIVKEFVPYAADPNTRDMANNELIRQSLEDMGFDGIIDNTVDVKFGSQRRVGQKMAGMTPDTVHTIVFDPANIRSVHAAFDPDNSSSANLLGQSIRAATRMPMSEVDAWVRANVTATESDMPGGDVLTVLKFMLTEDPDAPEVMLSIRLKERSNRRDQGRADVNLFLDNQMADALENVEDPVQRAMLAKIMFAKTVMVMRQYGQEYDVKAFNFTAAESQAEGTNAKSREDLYRFMLSSLSMPGYSAYEIESQTSIVNRDEDGAKAANPMLGMAGFVIIKDGVNVEDFAKNEILRGSQRGGDAGEVVTVARATPLGRRDTGDGSGRGRRGTGAADTGGAVDNSLGQEAPASPFYSQLQRVIERSATTRAPASQWLGIIRNAPGVKAEEVEWTGVQEYLEAQDGPVTREALAAFLDGNGVQVEEVVRGGASFDEDLQRKLLPLIEELDRLTDSMDPNNQASIDAVLPRYRELQDQIANIRETMNAGIGDVMDETKWSSYTLPGGENYREMLLTLPVGERSELEARIDDLGARMEAYDMSQGMGGFNALSIERDKLVSQRQTYRSSHWSEPNVLAHVRFKERTGPNGERVLALEEVQSDWHQAGRERGYKPKGEPPSFEDWYAGNGMALFGEPFDQLDARAQGMARQRWEDATRRGFTGAIPDAPFKNNAWAELVLKRMIRWAADNGFDSVAWIPGNIQNGRIVEDTGDNRGDFYDKILPNIANKLGKKYGARSERLEFDLGPDAAGSKFEILDADGNSFGRFPSEARANGVIMSLLADQPDGTFTVSPIGPFVTFHSLPLTDALRTAAISEGFPLFQPGDPKGWGETAPPPNLPPMRLDLAETERLYGKEAVAKLPKAIRDRGRDQTSIDSMFAIARATAKTLRRKPPKSLFQFIRSRKARTVEGKTVPVKQWGIRGAADELKAMDRADLINEENGIHIDYMRELAEEAGYLPEGSTVNDMLNAIDREARGEPVYSSQDQNEVLDYQNAEEWANWFDEQGVDITDKDEKALRAKLAQVVTSTAADAVTPDQAAELLGFNTGEELLAALAEIGNRERFIREETDRRMAAEFGDPYKDGTFAEAARQAAEIEVKARAAEIELEALARAVGESAASRMAKQMAEDALALMTVKELAGWTKFLDAERRHGRNALAATKKGDMAEAMLHKRRQLVSMHLAKAAREKSEALEKTRKDLMSYLTSKGRRDKIARDYLDKIEALLDQYELRASKQGPGTQRARLSAKQYVEQMIADGREAEIAPEAMLLAEMADAKVWRDLLAEEADYLAGTVRNLAHLGRTKNKLMKAQDKRRFDAVVAELVDTLVASPTTRPRAQSFTPTTVERIAKGLREFDARMTRLEFQLQKLDGRENGPLWNALFRPFADASDVETEMMRGAAGSMRDLYEAFTADERRQLFHRRVATPEIDAPGKGLTLMDVVVIGLNWGNEGNRKALIDGYGWDPAQVEAMLNRVLTDKHWDFIEGTWSLIESYKAEAFALEKAITGVEPKAVAGVDFTLASGRVIKGKYYPLKYDGAQARADSVVISRLDEKQALSDLGKTFSKPMTKTGHLIERVGSGGKPVKINISVMHDHVQNVIHDIAYRRAVIDAHRMIRDPRFANAYIAAAGREQYDQLLPWLAAIATERNGDPGGIVTKIMQVGRRNMTVVAMGYKVGTALQQITGPIQGMTMIGPAYVAQGFVRALAGGPGSFWSAWKWVSAKSEFMRDRPQGFDRDMRMVTNRLQERTPLGAIQRNSMILTQIVDVASSTIVWIGAYQRALDGNVEGIAKGAEEDAIAWADSVVRQTQAAGKIQDLPQIMRGTEAEKLVTMMFSYFSGLYNLTRKQGSMTRFGQMSPMVFMANMALLFVVTPLFAAVLAGRFPPDDEDEEELAPAVAKELASNAAGTIPIFRDIVNASLNPQFGYQMSPVGSGIDRLTSAAARAGAGETLESEAAVKEAVNALGILFGLPTAQLVIMGDYANDLATGEEDPTEDPVDAAREALVRSNR
jgi:hypothetical protein